MISTREDIDVLLVGAFPTEQELEGDPRIIINKQNSIQFRLKVISEAPRDLRKQFFTCYGSQIEGWEDTPTLDKEIRLNRFIEYVEDKVFIFQPQLRQEEGRTHYNVSTARFPIIKNRPKNVGENSNFIPIPYANDYSTFEFETRLLESRTIGELGKYQNYETPQFVLNGEYLYGEFLDHKRVSTGLILLADKINKLKFQPDIYEGYVLIHKDIVFIDSVLCRQKLPKWFAEKGNTVTGEVLYHRMEEDYSQDPNHEHITSFIKEGDFIEHLKNTVTLNNLFYDKKELTNFHVAIKTGSLVLLSGMSGTGKSKLVDMYAKALGIFETEQYKVISVKPNWTDDSDLIGFLDTLNNIYRPADSGLVDLLIEAQDNENHIYLINFDEMNLARVEHYFSQFLSVLEMEVGQRKLSLYNPKLKDKVFNSSHYPPEIEIGENVFFTGTINIDESTHQFSDKVLDRANLIKSKVTTFDTWMENAFKPLETSKSIPVISYNDFSKWKNRDKQPVLTNDEINFLQDYHDDLQKVDSMFGIGYRIIVQIDKYLKNIPDTTLVTRKEAFDYQFAQRVLPKLKGSEQQLEKILGNLNAKGQLFDWLDIYTTVSDFTISRQILEQKLRELIYHGYTS
ncbi:hypothetical protein ABE65_000940 [Fictibacillus phosphorivorans]|uniref:ATPase dynein-related AAA domain-containing protein n=1 Tax=Fictibacillus phosphorivorans TaxID=1221500 RepID=A0A160IHU7_9BACL|nr:hypothetical protein [Fictibacillus phosphorivorans]ANC75503.1 hypothetical protein ABE65_000940 [Fictibacillus phosphorivorans]